MSRSIKVKGFFKDIGGAGRVTKLRREKFESASPVPRQTDPIRSLADRLHPNEMRLKLISVANASPTARTFRFQAIDGHLPVFQSGQYATFRLKIGGSVLTRPYSISSAPYEATGADGFFEITVRRNRHYLAPDYLFDQVRTGDILNGALAFGNFYWEPLRDTKNIVALAGGSGIAPFHSMAKEIACGKMRGCHLTILYGSMKSDDIVLKEELDRIANICPDVRVVHVLSDEPDWPGEKGFLSREIIEKYAGADPTYMFCGPYPMYRFVAKTMQEMGTARRRFRCDVINNPTDVTLLPGYPKGVEGKTFRITVARGIREDIITASAKESVAVALERAAIALDTHCRNGECGFCRSQLISGEVFVSPLGDGRRLMDKEMGWFHPCSSWPLSDLKIRIPIM